MEEAWTDDDVFTLIGFYEQNSCLHDVTSAEYRNKTKKRMLENDIATILHKTGKQHTEM